MDRINIFTSAFEHLHSGVLLLDKATGRVIEANPAFLRICGGAHSAVVGRVFWAPPLIDDAEAGAEVFAHLRAGGLVEGAELPLRTGDGSCLLLEMSGGELPGGVVQLEVRDATGRAGARAAERMHAQRSLASRAAGEFGELHGALQAASEMLTNCARRGESTFQESDEIRKAADRAAAIVRELQAYGGQLTLETGRVPLNQLIEDMQPALQQMLGRNIQVVADLSPDTAAVTADPAQVRQILLKLAANSGEAMEHAGTFRIVTRNAPADDPALGRTDESGAYTILEVGDQGPGLDDASWEHLYEPFFTTKPHGRRGLGLAAVHGIVRQMGGRLWAASDPGQGATFRIYLPQAAESVSQPAERDGCPVAATILLMEQNDGLRTVVSNILTKRGYRVLAAGAAIDALEMAHTQGPPDLLISEPEPDLARQLASLQPQLRTLFLNGHSEHAAGTATLSKPFELETFLGKVRELLEA